MPPSKLYEGPTIEEALAAAAADLGNEVEVIEATKERDGGLFGFFARERYVVLAKRGEPEESDSSDFGELLLGMAGEIQDTYEALSESSVEPTNVDELEPPPAEADPIVESVGVIDLRSGRRVQRDIPKRLPELTDHRVKEIRQARASVLTAEPAAVRVVDDPVGELVDAAPQWSVEALAGLGLPEAVLNYVEAFAPGSDIEWLHALTGAIGRLVRDGAAAEGVVHVAGEGRGAAIELIGGIPDGRLPAYITVDGEKVRATPDELALSIRDCLQ